MVGGKKMGTLKVVGLGPGHFDYILPIATKLINQADILVGGKRHIESINVKDQELFYIEGRLSELPEYIQNHIETKEIVVVVSGDTGFYSLLRYLKKNLENIKIESIPGISSMQYLFSKVQLTWDDAFLGSLHGRELDFVKLCGEYSKIGLLTDQKNPPQKIAELLVAKAIENKKMVIGERLSYEDEVVRICDLNEVSHFEYDDLNVVMIVDKELLQ